MTLVSSLYYRTYQNYFMPSRLGDYRRMLRRFRDGGYSFCTVAELADNLERGGALQTPFCILRNDIDSDPAGAAAMFGCDREAGIRATYYFRLTTIDRPLIEGIVRHGGEVGYHFEEIASAAKRLGLCSRQQIDARLHDIRADFRRNVGQFRERTGVRPRTIAPHGDFINRRLGMDNSYFLTPSLLAELGIVANAYEPRLYAALSERFTDRPAPHWWRPGDPQDSLAHNLASVCILVHPRQWNRNAAENFRLDAERVREEIAYRRKCRHGPR